MWKQLKSSKRWLRQKQRIRRVFLRQWLNDPAFLEIWLKKFEKRLQEIKEEIKKSSEKSYSGATERRGKSLNL
jgi:protoheme ferro-lyase